MDMVAGLLQLPRITYFWLFRSERKTCFLLQAGCIKVLFNYLELYYEAL